MPRPPLEVADIFRRDGETWRQAHAGHVSLAQLKVMSAIEHCRTDVLGGHRLHCNQCDTDRIAYNSCRNRHCPKCQGLKAEQWLADRQAELLPATVEAYYQSLPLVLLTADRPARFRGSGAPQAIEQAGIFGCYARCLDIEGDAAGVGAFLAKAIARGWRSGCLRSNVRR